MATRADFQRIENEFKRLTDQLAAGQITREQFDASLKTLMIQDQQGRYWTIGANTGKWYVNDGTQWVEALPPQEPAAGAPTPSAASVPPAASYTPAGAQPPMGATPQYSPAPQKSNNRKLIVIAIVVILVLCICVCACAGLTVYSGVLNSYLGTPTP